MNNQQLQLDLYIHTNNNDIRIDLPDAQHDIHNIHYTQNIFSPPHFNTFQHAIVPFVNGQVPDNNTNLTGNIPVLNSSNFEESILIDDEDSGKISATLSNHYDELRNQFPQATEEFLRKYCTDHKDYDLNKAIEDLTQNGFERRDKDSIWNTLKEALPLLDPTYLKSMAEDLEGKSPETLQNCVDAALDRTDLPTLKQYKKQQEDAATLKKYQQDEFDVDEFLKKYPDPENYFKNRANPLMHANDFRLNQNYALTFLHNEYSDISKTQIDLVFKMQGKSLTKTCCCLDAHGTKMRRTRPTVPLPECRNIALLEEVSYLKRRKRIGEMKKQKEELYNQFKEEARSLEILETCLICTEDELIPDECGTCPNGCVFCKECIKKYVEVKMGEGCTSFRCCNDCDCDFTLHSLQSALPEKMFNKLVLKIQSDELKRANVDGLETCPFCDFAAIPIQESSIFDCQNPDCSKPSCRLCKQESHIPKRCHEIEQDEDVRRRTYIENMMTEARTRTCYNCKKKFVKEGGCNKMQCSCGAMMCYLCSQPIKNYDHFGPRKCALHTNDNVVNLQRVMSHADMAKRELGAVELKIDPTEGLQQFF